MSILYNNTLDFKIGLMPASHHKVKQPFCRDAAFELSSHFVGPNIPWYTKGWFTPLVVQEHVLECCPLQMWVGAINA